MLFHSYVKLYISNIWSIYGKVMYCVKFYSNNKSSKWDTCIYETKLAKCLQVLELDIGVQYMFLILLYLVEISK